jgi:hypothetical protein
VNMRSLVAMGASGGRSLREFVVRRLTVERPHLTA